MVSEYALFSSARLQPQYLISKNEPYSENAVPYDRNNCQMQIKLRPKLSVNAGRHTIPAASSCFAGICVDSEAPEKTDWPFRGLNIIATYALM